MNIVPPVFFLNQLCPSCGQASCLCFTKCLSCNAMLLVCDEEGVTLPDLIQFDDGKCPKCGSPCSFRNATGEELQEMGYSSNDYH